MLLAYILAALQHARHEILSDGGGHYGEVPECPPGVYANAGTFEECRDQLAEVGEEGALFRIHQHLSLPELDGHELIIREVA